MSVTEEVGRFGNQVLRNLALSFLAEKFDLQTEYSSHPQMDRLGISLYSGTRSFSYAIPVTDTNYFEVYRQRSVSANLDLNASYFQQENHTTFFMAYLRSPSVQERIQAANPFKDRYNQNKDVFVHFRLGDAAEWALPLSYYTHCIQSLSYETLYFSTDSPDHEIVQTMKERFPDAILLSYDEIETIQFGSTCKYLILSHGSYSALIGYLAFFSTIFYLDQPVVWASLGLFSGKDWTAISPQGSIGIPS